MKRINLIEARKAANITQKQLGKLLNIANTTICDYENGRVKQGKPFIWDRLEVVLGVPQQVLRGKETA
jgi:transcriptional regulator with XRE-family HTH domain